MLKEIREQPKVIRKPCRGLKRLGCTLAANACLGEDAQYISILACGTSYHAGLVGKYLIEELLDIRYGLSWHPKSTSRTHGIH
jgi:glucosamine--fructose-6-phosphate aminotransferase (isomerizing)